MNNQNNYNPDVLSCLANLSSDEVFTPPAVVNQMLDMLPQELFRSPDTKFLDPACKSGVFLREIAKRLLKGLEPVIPDLEERIDHMLQSGALASLWDEGKAAELAALTQPSAKEEKKLLDYRGNKPKYDAILKALRNSISEEKYLSPESFAPVLETALFGTGVNRKLLDKIADGLSQMDKTAEIQRDEEGNILYDKETRDTETVKYEEDIDDYMRREVLPHIPDAKAFFEENLTSKNPIIRTGAEIPFTRYFYQYQQPRPSEELAAEFMTLEKSVSARIAELFSEAVNA